MAVERKKKSTDTEMMETQDTEVLAEPIEAVDLVEEHKETIPQILVYVGPTLASTLLWQNRTFSGGYPAEVGHLEKKHPYIKRLFVEPNKVPDAMHAIATKGSAMNVYFNRLKGE